MKYKAQIAPLITLISIIVIIDSIMDSIKIDLIKNNEAKTKAKVNFLGERYRFGYGMSYSCDVNNIRYKK